MVNFFVGILSVIGMFCACYALSLAPYLIKNSRRKPPVKTEPEPEQPLNEKQTAAQPQVFYLTTKPKQKKRTKPKPKNIALKGALMPPQTVIIADSKIIKNSDSPAIKGASSTAQPQRTVGAKEAKKTRARQPSTFSPSPQRRSK